ncbi:hypothetical protein H5410_037747 [Solanum commersonii]|uniref:Uncharacterized protein n=1 Tax=Solanum commersonii TaxID=4109 RepID=A0A9J5Y750_SOLCO|nr:hypothetical protein H5410_037747 [Solanum commersonii]
MAPSGKQVEGSVGSKRSRKGDAVNSSGQASSRHTPQKFGKQADQVECNITLVREFQAIWDTNQRTSNRIEVRRKQSVSPPGLEIIKGGGIAMGFDDPFNWREGVEGELHNLCPPRPHLVCQLVDVTKTKAQDTSHGPVLSIVDCQAQDNS